MTLFLNLFYFPPLLIYTKIFALYWHYLHSFLVHIHTLIYMYPALYRAIILLHNHLFFFPHLSPYFSHKLTFIKYANTITTFLLILLSNPQEYTNLQFPHQSFRYFIILHLNHPIVVLLKNIIPLYLFPTLAFNFNHTHSRHLHFQKNC